MVYEAIVSVAVRRTRLNETVQERRCELDVE